MARWWRFSVASRLAASPEEVWRIVSTMPGVNAELSPLVRMTFPAGLSALDPALIRPGRRLFRSWLLFLGCIPIDFDDLTFAWIEPGVGFLEESTMLSQRAWRHERLRTPIAGGCRVTDRVNFAPRLVLLGPVYRLIFVGIFRLRHRRLRRWFGTIGASRARSA